MDVIHRCCAGLDVHKKTVQACVRQLDAQGQVAKEFRAFGTTTCELLALADWLAQHGVTHAAMESTGVFWKPVYNLLEGRFEVLLCNARHIKNVPGRKTDMKDSEWIAQLLQFGLLQPSFIPPKPVRELRDLTRTRAALQDDKARVANRIHKVLEDANIKLGSVATDILGASGRAMLQALIAGQTDPGELAQLARKRLRQKLPQLKLALQGQVTEHHRFMLRLLLEQLRELEGHIERLNQRIEAVIASPALSPESTATPAIEPAVPGTKPKAPLPFLAAINLLVEMWGIDRCSAENILAEIGTDMSRFPTDKHQASWAGICPGNNESAGKQRSGTTKKGNRWLRRALTQAGWAATHAKASYMAAKYHRLAPRRGKQRALVAVAHSMLRAIYHMLKEHVAYRDLGPTHFDDLHRERTRRNLVQRLQSMGYSVTLAPAQAAS